MRVAYSKNTMAGAARIAEERRSLLLPSLVAPQHKPAPAARPAGKVLTFRRPAKVEEPTKAFLQTFQPYSPPSPRTVIHRVAAWHGSSYETILGQSRLRRVVDARYDAVAAVYLICRPSSGRPLSLPQLGRIFGDRDHTTMLNALRRRGLKK